MKKKSLGHMQSGRERWQHGGYTSLSVDYNHSWEIAAFQRPGMMEAMVGGGLITG